MLVERSELTGGDFNYRVTKTIPAGDSPEEAQAKALEVARKHLPYGGARSCTREIYRSPDGVLRVVFKESWGYNTDDFRVSVAELIEAHEPDPPAEDETSRPRKFGRFRK
ncbi:DUF493 domain-containing protein [Actinomadura rupiterrae]|uniref:DUF493 domain-containing protein n=1 Tax=Actinomadura rupiterrae TaxID=559627 RepID=UPI0020A5E0D5|nr:DUF493 domain-containing protein [Actinomadura rupiterrae]MCP2340279.1 hypothetical protein [Actinomadura rupiterrae]